MRAGLLLPFAFFLLACASGRDDDRGRVPRRDAGDRFDSGPIIIEDGGGERDSSLVLRDAGDRDSGFRPRDAGPPDAGPPNTGPPDTSPPDTGPVGGELVNFPSVGDRWTIPGEHVWMTGAYVEGDRTSIARTTRAEVHAVFDYNGLTCDNQDMRLTIDGVEAGRFSIAPGATMLDVTFTFAAATGPAYTLRYENTREVIGGCGSARFDKTLSTIRLIP